MVVPTAYEMVVKKAVLLEFVMAVEMELLKVG